MQLSKPKILDALDRELDMFSDKLLGTNSTAIIGGIHLFYLHENISMLAKVLGYPKLFLKVLHGCYRGESRDFVVLGKECGKLLKTAAAQENKTDLGLIQREETEKFLDQLEQSKMRLIENSEKWGCGMLDHYRLPHPLLGKITVRETLYVTILEVKYRRRLLSSSHLVIV